LVIFLTEDLKMILTEREKNLVLAGYISGYERGHNDTVESGYTDSEESAKDWLQDALNDSGLEYTVRQLAEI